MSCRLIKHESAAGAKAIVWSDGRQAVPAESRDTPRANLYAESKPADRAPEIALREAEQRIAEAYQRGLREGDAAATQRMAQQLTAKIEQLSRSIEQLALHRGKHQRDAEPGL